MKPITMLQIISSSFLSIGFAGCYSDAPCYCRKDGVTTVYTVRDKTSNGAQEKCDAMAAGDTCEITLKK